MVDLHEGHDLPGAPEPDAPRAAREDAADPYDVDGLQVFLREIGRVRLLTARQEVELAKRIERGDMRAKERLVEANLRLVVHIAKRYQRED